ncbi:peptidase inhibitor family I36 protein [Actinomyces trachealis]|uniref:peptidase inhibitor family I36 protein n=1 Tax=Actinomyces trachealis TaxID=2763540 RepID=UPI0039A4EDAB
MLVGLAVGLAALGVTAPASASAYCEKGYTCVYQDAYYSNGQLDFSRFIPQFTEWHFEGQVLRNASNKASSVWNNGRYESSFLYDHAWGRGRCLGVARGSWVDDLNTKGFNDITSSGYFDTYAPRTSDCRW